MLEAQDYYIEDFAVIDVVAEDGFTWKAVSTFTRESGDLRGQRTWPAKEYRILRIFCAQFLYRLVHWNKSSISDRASEDRWNRHVAFSKEKLMCGTVDAVRANDCMCCCSGAVFDATFFRLDGLEALVEMCTSSRHCFDEFFEEMSPVYTFHTAWRLLGTDNFVSMLAFALIERSISVQCCVPRKAQNSLPRATQDST